MSRLLLLQVNESALRTYTGPDIKTNWNVWHEHWLKQAQEFRDKCAATGMTESAKQMDLLIQRMNQH